MKRLRRRSVCFPGAIPRWPFFALSIIFHILHRSSRAPGTSSLYGQNTTDKCRILHRSFPCQWSSVRDHRLSFPRQSRLSLQSRVCGRREILQRHQRLVPATSQYHHRSGSFAQCLLLAGWPGEHTTPFHSERTLSWPQSQSRRVFTLSARLWSSFDSISTRFFSGRLRRNGGWTSCARTNSSRIFSCWISRTISMRFRK